MEGIGTNLVNATMSVGKTVYNVFIAIFLALYMLIDKDTLLSQVSRVSEAVLWKGFTEEYLMYLI